MKDKSWVIPFLNESKNRNNAELQYMYLEEIKKHLPKFLYKYYSFEDSYSLFNLENDIIYFSKPNVFNDPFDCNFAYNIDFDTQRLGIDKNLYENYLYEASQSAKKTVDDRTLITCFSESSNNILMWSHYANKHTGFCVEYDISLLDNFYKLNLFPVLYSNNRPEQTEIIKKGINNVAALYTGLLTKSNEWDYENEWRIILLDDGINKDKICQNIITKVFCGLKTSNENLNNLKLLVNKKNKTRTINGKIQLYFYEMDNLKYELIQKTL